MTAGPRSALAASRLAQAVRRRWAAIAGRRRPAAGASSRHRAYNIVVLAVAVTLLNVWVASVMPLWSQQIKRDKEAELIFRGLQYAEAIRLFQLRNNRAPVRLEELIEVQPRCIRQLWPNPMHKDGRWGLIPLGVNPTQVGQPVQQAGQPGNPSGSEDDFGGDGFSDDSEDGVEPGVILSADPNDDGFGSPPASSVPIRGVFSPISEESVLTFMGKANHREWHFTADIFATMKQGTPENPALVTPFLAKEIGRPWPPGVVPQVPQPSDQPPKATNQRRPGDGHQPERKQGDQGGSGGGNLSNGGAPAPQRGDG